MKLTKDFTLDELTKSATAKRKGIDNTPSEEVIANLTTLCVKVLQPLRNAYGEPIIITSGYRCDKLNKAVGGAKNSHHRYGMAADIRTVSDRREDNRKLFDLVKTLDLPFTQLIDEYNYDWVHVSFDPKNNKRQILHTK